MSKTFVLRIIALLSICLLAGTGRIAAATALDGTWSGMLDFGNGSLLFVITMSTTNGTLAATAASPYQGVGSISVDTISQNGDKLTFTIKKLDVAYSGTIADGAIDGSFTQRGKTVPLVLVPSSVGTTTLTGTWLGTLTTSGGKLLIALHVQNTGAAMTATLDSPYQRGFGIPVSSIAASNGTLTFALKDLNASYTGKIGPAAIDGTFTQNGQTFPLKLSRP